MVANGFTRLRLAREEADKLFAHFRALTEGVKELKLHRSRRGKFLSGCIQAATENFSRHNVAAESASSSRKAGASCCSSRCSA